MKGLYFWWWDAIVGLACNESGCRYTRNIPSNTLVFISDFLLQKDATMTHLEIWLHWLPIFSWFQSLFTLWSGCFSYLNKWNTNSHEGIVLPMMGCLAHKFIHAWSCHGLDPVTLVSKPSFIKCLTWTLNLCLIFDVSLTSWVFFAIILDNNNISIAKVTTPSYPWVWCGLSMTLLPFHVSFYNLFRVFWDELDISAYVFFDIVMFYIFHMCPFYFDTFDGIFTLLLNYWGNCMPDVLMCHLLLKFYYSMGLHRITLTCVFTML